MKKLPVSLVMIALVSIALISCVNSGTDKNADDSQKLKANLEEDTYNPGPGWSLVWSDEFNSGSIDTNNWNFQVVDAGRFNDEWQRYTNSPENAYIEDDCLVIRAIHVSDTHGMDQYTSARMHTANKQSWTYGKIVARLKLPEGNGIWPAFWMLGANIDENGGDTPWPESGEIDILELYGSKDPAVAEANIHFSDETGSHGMMGAAAYKLEEGKFADGFHTFALDWDSTRVAWLVDENEFASMSISEDHFSEFHKDFFVLLNLAVGGRHAGRPDSTSIFPNHMYVDWVRVYQKEE